MPLRSAARPVTITVSRPVALSTAQAGGMKGKAATRPSNIARTAIPARMRMMNYKNQHTHKLQIRHAGKIAPTECRMRFFRRAVVQAGSLLRAGGRGGGRGGPG